MSSSVNKFLFLKIVRSTPLIAAAGVCALQIWVFTQWGEGTQLLFSVGLTLALSLLVFILEAFGLWHDTNKIYVLNRWLLDAIDREQRLYANLAGPYLESQGGPQAYKSFVETVERIIAIVREH